MADNIRSSIGTNDGVVFATDADDTQSPSVHYPLTKLVFGPLNTFTLASTTDGLPVQQQSGATFAVTQSGTWSIAQSGTWSVTQSGTWTMQPGNTANTTPWLVSIHDGTTRANVRAIAAGFHALNVAVTDGSGNHVTDFGGTASDLGSALPTKGTAAGYSDGTNMQAARVFDVDSGAGTQYVQGVNLRLAASGGSVQFGTSSDPIRVDPTGTTAQPVNPISGQTGVAAGAGAVGASTQRVTLASDDPAVASLSVLDDWDESDRCKVNPISGQAGVAGGSGTVSALTQRVVLATDVALPTGTNNIGDVDVLTVGGQTPAFGNGAVTAGTQRIALADISAGDYETVAASQTDQSLGATGATGDYLAGVLVVPATTSPGAVSIKDGSGSAITIFTGGASSVSNLVPFFVPLGIISTSGAWKVTTGTNVSAIGVGNFA